MANKNMTVWVIVIIGALFFLGGGMKLFSGNTPQATNANSPAAAVATGQCTIVPTYSYSAVNAKTQGTAVTGTSYYKLNGLAPSTTALTSPTVGQALSYWLSNSTYFCAPTSTVAQCSANSVQSQCYQNGTLSIAVWDTDNSNAALTAGGGATNITMGANSIQNIEIRYKGSANQANMPLGGCVAIEVPQHVMIKSVSGSGISNLQPCPYQWTYTVSATTNTYGVYAVPSGFDTDGLGVAKPIDVQLQADSSNPAGTFYVTFAPANYYVANDGSFALGIEKDKNQDTTKTFGGPAAASFGIT